MKAAVPYYHTWINALASWPLPRHRWNRRPGQARPGMHDVVGRGCRVLFAGCRYSQTEPWWGNGLPLELSLCHMHLVGTGSASPEPAPPWTCGWGQLRLLSQAWRAVHPALVAAPPASARDGIRGCGAGCRPRGQLGPWRDDPAQDSVNLNLPLPAAE